MRQVDIATVLSRSASSQGGRLGLQVASEHMTLRELIARVVQVEIERRELTDAATLQELMVTLLGVSGPVALVGRLNRQEETARALDAFKHGCYRVFLNGREVTELDERLALGLRSLVTFVRALPLVSG